MPDEQVPNDAHQDAAVLADAAGRVSENAEALTQQLAGLRKDLADARVKSEKDIEGAKEKAAAEVAAERRDRHRAAWKFAIVIAVDIVLSLVGIGLWYSQMQTNDRLEVSLHQNYVTSEQQAVTRTKVLCPLYGLLLASLDPAKRAALPPPQRLVYDRTVRVIQDGYGTLGCQPALPTASPSLPH